MTRFFLGSASRDRAARLMRYASLVLTLACAVPLVAESSATPPQLPGAVSIAQKLNSQVPLNLMFHDENGAVVRLGQYFDGSKPVILNFVYYRCPMLCPLVLNGMTSAMTELKYNIGKDFDVITVSIDPRDTPKAAMEMKEKYVTRYGRFDAASGWHFLTGNDTTIHRLADAVGFQYAYDGKADQFAHGAALILLTPQGVTSRYFYGFEFKALDLRMALREASQGKIGGFVEQVLLLCYHYDPRIGKYSRDAMIFVRAGGAATVALLGGMIFVLVRKERRKALEGSPE